MLRCSDVSMLPSALTAEKLRYHVLTEAGNRDQGADYRVEISVHFSSDFITRC